jgi:xylulose-5-phosphate/fructose-6-phosphate phosphoketolase
MSAVIRKRERPPLPFDMVVLNDLDRFHLVSDVIDPPCGLAARAAM